MFVRLLERVMEVRLLQLENDILPMSVTLSGIVIEVRPVHPSNALSPMRVKPFGSVIEVKALRFLKAESLISVAPPEITIVVNWSESGNVEKNPLSNTYPGAVTAVSPKQ